MNVWVLAVMISVAAGCAKKPTTIVTDVAADPNVPPLLILASTITSAADPTRSSRSEQSSLAPIDVDAGDRPGPFYFPLRLALSVDPSMAGPVTVEVAGLDWDTRAILAAGSATGEVIPEQDTYTAVTLTAPDAGTDSSVD